MFKNPRKNLIVILIFSPIIALGATIIGYIALAYNGVSVDTIGVSIIFILLNLLFMCLTDFLISIFRKKLTRS